MEQRSSTWAHLHLHLFVPYLMRCKCGNTVHTWVSYYWGSNIDSPNSNGLSLHFYMICFNGFLLLVVLSNLTLKLVWLVLVNLVVVVVAAAAPVGALEESLTRARRSWGWSRSLGESTAWSRCSRPWKSQPFRSRLREVRDLMKGSPAHPRAVKREQAMMTGNGFSAAKLPSLKNAASNLGKKSWKPRCRRFFDLSTRRVPFDRVAGWGNWTEGRWETVTVVSRNSTSSPASSLPSTGSAG